MTKLHVLLIGLIAFLGLCWFCIRFHAPVIEQDMTMLAQARLYADNLDNIEAHASGRHVTLSGTIANEQIRSQAMSSVANMEGITGVSDQMVLAGKANPKAADNGMPQPVHHSQGGPAEKEEPYQLLLQFDGKSMQLEGVVPSQNSQTLLQQTAMTSLSADQYQVRLEIRDPAPSLDWDMGANALLQALLGLQQGEALLENGRWQLIGKAAHAGQQRATRSSLIQAMPKHFIGSADIALTLSKESQLCQETLDQALAQQTIQFQVSSAQILEESIPFLQQLLGIAQKCPEIQIQIQGHSDASGDALANQDLSQAQAETVRDFFIANGMSAQNLTAKGFGAQFPIATNADAQGRAKNRRIEIIILEPTP